MHFLQVDIAVRDSRADDTTGWVFGTFMYHDSVENENPWKRLMPVCLMWGNNPDLNAHEASLITDATVGYPVNSFVVVTTSQANERYIE